MVGPRPLVLCGPSGSGKSTLLNKLLKEYPDSFGFSVSHTTRQPRPGEINGQHYHFVEKEVMLKAIEDGEFIESATFSGNMYGTSKAAVDVVLNGGKVCILDIDVQGVKQVRQTHLKPYFVFVKPPSLEDLERRLQLRNTETKESLTLRLNNAEAEIQYGTEPGNFDIIIVNDDLENAYGNLREFISTNVLENK